MCRCLANTPPLCLISGLRCFICMSYRAVELAIEVHFTWILSVEERKIAREAIDAVIFLLLDHPRGLILKPLLQSYLFLSHDSGSIHAVKL